MNRTRLIFASALLAGGLILSISVYGLSEAEEPVDSQVPAAVLDEIDVEEIQAEVERSLEPVPWDEISAQLADARGVLDSLDLDAIRAEVEAAMAELDVEEIRAEARQALDEVDWDEIRQDVEAAHAEIEAMDLEDVRADVREALAEVDWDEIRRTLEEASGLAAEELEALDELLEELGTGSSGVI